MLHANDVFNEANHDFQSALDKNTQLSESLKRQMRYHTTSSEHDSLVQASNASGNYSERAEAYLQNTKVVRNTAVGA